MNVKETLWENLEFNLNTHLTKKMYSHGVKKCFKSTSTEFFKVPKITEYLTS